MRSALGTCPPRLQVSCHDPSAAASAASSVPCKPLLSSAMQQAVPCTSAMLHKPAFSTSQTLPQNPMIDNITVLHQQQQAAAQSLQLQSVSFNTTSRQKPLSVSCPAGRLLTQHSSTQSTQAGPQVSGRHLCTASSHSAATSHVRSFSCTVSCQQPSPSSQELPSQSGPQQTTPKVGFLRRPPLSQPNSASGPSGSHRRPPVAPNGQEPVRPGSQRAPLQRSPFPRPSVQPNRNEGAFPSQLVGPTYRNAKRNAIEPPIETKRLKANQDITAREVRLVSTDGTHRVLPLAEALTAAREAKLDLVQVAGGAVPPVCRLLNHSQVSFEAKVKERKAEKKQHENRRISMIKEVHFGAHTAEHDLQVKVKKAKEFLQKGHRVKCTLKHKPVRGQGQKEALNALPLLKERMAIFAEVSAPPVTEKQTPNTLSFYLAPLVQQQEA